MGFQAILGQRQDEVLLTNLALCLTIACARSSALVLCAPEFWPHAQLVFELEVLWHQFWLVLFVVIYRLPQIELVASFPGLRAPSSSFKAIPEFMSENIFSSAAESISNTPPARL